MVSRARAWDDLEQGRIQVWIRRIMRHVKQVIHLEGGNEYREGEFYMDDEKPRTRGLRGAADTFSAKRRTLLVATSIQLLTFSSNPCLELQQKGTYLATIEHSKLSNVTSYTCRELLTLVVSK